MKTSNIKSEIHWLTGIQVIAEYIGFGKTKTSSLLKSGDLKHYRVGKKIMVRKIDVDSFIMFNRPYQKLTRPQKETVKADV